MHNKILYFIIVLIGCAIAVFILSRPINKNHQSNSGKYNLILISIDTLRADHMGVYGYGKNTTPRIDDWARSATVYTNMHTIIPATLPSFAILMTGKSPFQSKMYNNFGVVVDGKTVAGGRPLGNDAETLAEVFKKYGYKTGAYVTNDALSPQLTNMNKGFDQYNFKSNAILQKQNYRDFILQSLDWLKTNKKHDFFLWVHLTSPHAPYNPPADYRCRFDRQHCNVILNKNWEDLEDERKYMKGCQVSGIAAEDVNIQRTLYDGEIAYDDEIVGKILDTIKFEGLDKNSVVVIYGDHGEGFDHNYYFMHSHVLYESSLRIPFIIKQPNEKFHVDQTFYDNTRIFPLLLSLTHNTTRQFIPGKGLADEYSYFINTNLTKYGISDGHHKYLYSMRGSCLVDGELEELYDLKKDKNETINIKDANPIVFQKMKKALFDYLKRYNLPNTINMNSSDHIENNTNNEKTKSVIENLKSIGY